MSGLKISAFSGIAPKLSSRNLPNGCGQIAENGRFIQTGLKAFSEKIRVIGNTLKIGEVKTLFRMSYGGLDQWLSWTTDVDCVRGQVAGDTSERIYWSGDSEPRTSNLGLAVAGGKVMPASFFVLGVAAPLVAPTVGCTGGAAANEDRVYIETFVTPWGEEGAPSPASAVTTGKQDGTWTISALNAAPANSGSVTGASLSSGSVIFTAPLPNYLRAGEEVTIAGVVGMTDLNGTWTISEQIDPTHFKVPVNSVQTYASGGTWTRKAPHNTTGMKRRIYRSLNGGYYFAVELPIATTSWVDTVAGSELQEAIPTIGYLMPPGKLKGLIAHPNGFMVGFDGNDLYFSEPWKPYAWPIKYSLSCVFEIVSVGIFGSTIVVGTKGYPYIVTGSHPGGMSMDKTDTLEPCISKRSMVDVGTGVLYASPNGMVFIGNGGVSIATHAQFSKDEWKFINPSSLYCRFHNGLVFGWHSINTDLHTGFIFDVSTGAFSTTALSINAAYVDPETNKLYVVDGTKVYQIDAHPYNDLTFDWKSKVFSLNAPTNFGYGMIDAEMAEADKINMAIAADIAYNAAILATFVGEILGAVYSAGSVVIQVNALGELALDSVMDITGVVGMTDLNARHTVAEVVDATHVRVVLTTAQTYIKGGTWTPPVTNGEFGGSMLGEYPLQGSLLRGGAIAEYTTRSLRMTIYGDGVERYTENITGPKSFSLPSGFKARLWEFRLSGNIQVHSLSIAESATGLRNLA